MLMNIRVYAYMGIYPFFIRIYAYNYMHICVYLYAHTRILIRIYTHTYTHIREYLYAYYAHILVNIYLSGTVNRTSLTQILSPPSPPPKKLVVSLKARRDH